MFFSMLVSLYTARVILNTLGVEDYGIYNVVGGLVTLFGFINASMATGTQRFLTFELGKEDYIQLNRVFSMSLNIHVLIALIVFIIAETVGLWFLNTKLVIPDERLYAANWVYQVSVLSAIITTTQVPYTASIIAHERFGIYAYVGIAEVIFRLVIVFLLVWISSDKLILFALLSFSISVGIAFFYRLYSKKKFKECSYIFFWNKPLFNSLIGFSGWSLLGNTSHILLTQGMNILINIFFGVAVNAARAITMQVENAINSFVSNFMVAINPQITKNYAAGNFEEMKALMQQGSKFSFFVFFLLSFPVFLEAEIIMSLWLKTVPQYTVIFIRLNLIVTLIYTLTNTYLTGIFATGNIKKYQLMIAVMVAVLFSLTYVLLTLGFSPEITYIIYIIIALFVLIFRIQAIKSIIGFSLIDFFKSVLLKAILVLIVSIPLPILMLYLIEPSFLRLIIVTLTSVILTAISILFVGLTKFEKEKITFFIFSKLKIVTKGINH